MKIAIILAVTLTTITTARASLIGTVAHSVTPIGSGQFRYAYTLGNDVSSTGNIFDVSFTGVGADPSDFSIPMGWTYLVAPGFVDWSSTDPSFDILPGQTLEGFGFTSSGRPIGGQFLAISIDNQTGMVDFWDGSTVVPAEVPEPATSIVVLISLALLLGVRRWQI